MDVLKLLVANNKLRSSGKDRMTKFIQVLVLK
jgi:hypothetical protein